jgi:hypothetical protein
MRRAIDGSLAVLRHGAAVQQDPAVIVHRLELHPDVEGIDRPAWEKVPDLAGSHDDFDPDRLAPSHDGVDLVQRREHFGGWRDAASPAPGKRRRFLADGKGTRELGTVGCGSRP